MINSRVPSNLLVSRIATDIIKQQNSLAAVQEQISTGKKINRPSDAPAETAHLISMEETLSRLDQYTKNSSIAESNLSLEEGALAGSTEALNRIRDLALRSQSSLADDGFREELNTEIKLALEGLYTLANSRDSFGNYLFAGSNIYQQPFKPGNPVSYSGSDESSSMEIALGRTIETGDSGVDVFMRIRNGNGDFQTSATATNTGTGTISTGAVTDTSLFTGSEYEITFTSPTSYDVIDSASGAVVQSAQPYQENTRIDVDGMMMAISGVPDTDDSFSIRPSEYQDMFSSISKLIDAIDVAPAGPSDSARQLAAISTSINDIDNALNHLNTKRSSVGTRLNSIDNSRDENENISLQIDRIKQDVEDVDIADAITRLQTQANSLEILQKSFTRIEGLSLFNFM